MFGLSLALLRHGDVCRFVAVFYPCEGDSYKQDKFDQSKISNYGRQYVEEMKLQILFLLFYQICRLYADLLYY